MVDSSPNADFSDARSRLRQLICEAIAQGTPYSVQDVVSAYEALGSFDLVLTACDYAASAGIQLSNVIDALMLTKDESGKSPAT